MTGQQKRPHRFRLWGNFFYTAFLCLKSHPLRSILAILGIAIGSGAVVAMLYLGGLAEEMALSSLKALGPDRVGVRLQSRFDDPRTPNWDREEVAAWLNPLPFVKQWAAYAVSYPTVVFSPLQEMSPRVYPTWISTTPSLSSLMHFKLADGRWFSDWDGSSPYLVVGDKWVQDLKKKGVWVQVGTEVAIRDRYYQVIGILSPVPQNGVFEYDANRAIFSSLDGGALEQNLHQFVMQIPNEWPMSEVEKRLKNSLKPSFASMQVVVRDPAAIVQGIKKEAEIFEILLGAIGSISLLVGGIGMMNVFLVSITERRREIGIRLAVGATPGQIRAQFLIEALFFSGIGGFLGLLWGILAPWLVAWWWGWPFHFLSKPIVASLILTAVSGFLFGFYPAHVASLWRPVDALKEG